MAESDIAVEPTPSTAVASEVVIERAAQIAAAGMPLADGLRAAAEEVGSRRDAAALRRIAGEIERGRSLQDCLTAQKSLPAYVAGLIRASERTGELGVTLAAWSLNRRSALQYWRTVLAALAYPGIVVCLAIGVFMFLAVSVIPTFRTMYMEFGLKLPAPTTYLLRTSEFATWYFPSFLGSLVVLCLATRLLGGASAWSCLVSNLPLVGRAWHWTGVSEMLRGLSLLVDHRVPLPEALRLTAGGIRDAYVATQCRELAARVAEGRSLTMSLVALRTLPLSIVPLIRCGEQQDTLAASLRSAAQMLEGRLKLQTNVLAQIVPPIVFAFLAVFVASTIISLFLPMISLIQGLS